MLEKWFGAKGSAWANRKTGEPLRAVTLPGDSELITRHEATGFRCGHTAQPSWGVDGSFSCALHSLNSRIILSTS
jgi:hypothetical protein